MKSKEDFIFSGHLWITRAVMASLMNVPSIWKYQRDLNIRLFITQALFQLFESFFNGVGDLWALWGNIKGRFAPEHIKT